MRAEIAQVGRAGVLHEEERDGRAGEGLVILPFATIEGAILARPLPRTPRHPRGYRQWWRGSGAGFPHAWYGWQRAGWTVEAIELVAETVTFMRTGARR